MAKIDLISNEWADIVFQGRNKVYGAYQLRRSTGKRNIWAMVFVAAVAAVTYVRWTLSCSTTIDPSM